MVKVKFLGEEPKKSRDLDAAFDLISVEEATVYPGARGSIPTGSYVWVPDGYVGLVCPRSGLALNHGISVLNAPGVIDPGYTGEIRVILQNSGVVPFEIHPGYRIAQLLIVPTAPVEFEPVEILESSVRGDQGFGSSGM